MKTNATASATKDLFCQCCGTPESQLEPFAAVGELGSGDEDEMRLIYIYMPVLRPLSEDEKREFYVLLTEKVEQGIIDSEAAKQGLNGFYEDEELDVWVQLNQNQIGSWALCRDCCRLDKDDFWAKSEAFNRSLMDRYQHSPDQ